MSTTHESYLIWACSEQERSEWVSALRRCMYKEKGGGVFGSPLKDVMAYDNKKFGYTVPHIVLQSTKLIRSNGLEAEGIFRLSGRLVQVKELKRRYDEGERPDFEQENVDIHSAASLLKLYFRDLPEPVIPFEHFESFLSLATSFRYNSNHEATFQSLKTLIKQIPEENYNLLDHLSCFLHEISLHQNINKMTEKNIAVIFGTNILRGEDNSPEFQMATQNLTTHVVLALVKWHSMIFCEEKTEINATVNAQEFEQLVSISEEPVTSVPSDCGLLEPSADSVADLADIVFSNDQVAQEDNTGDSSVVLPPVPPVPPVRRTGNVGETSGSISSADCNATGNPETVTAPKPTPRAQKYNNEIVPRRVSTKRAQRPVALVVDEQVQQNRKSSTIPISKSEKAQSNFQSFIDSPLGDLPNNVEDLQALVLSLKIEIKEVRKENTLLKKEINSHKQQTEQLARTIFEEKQVKDDALSRVLHLAGELAQYQSHYGPIEPLS